MTYKELWDCYRNMFRKEDLHPYDKIHPFDLGKMFVRMMSYHIHLRTLSEATVGNTWFKTK